MKIKYLVILFFWVKMFKLGKNLKKYQKVMCFLKTEVMTSFQKNDISGVGAGSESMRLGTLNCNLYFSGLRKIQLIRLLILGLTLEVFFIKNTVLLIRYVYNTATLLMGHYLVWYTSKFSLFQSICHLGIRNKCFKTIPSWFLLINKTLSLCLLTFRVSSLGITLAKNHHLFAFFISIKFLKLKDVPHLN